MRETFETKNLLMVATHLRIALRFIEQHSHEDPTGVLQTVLMHVEGAYEMLKNISQLAAEPVEEVKKDPLVVPGGAILSVELPECKAEAPSAEAEIAHGAESVLGAADTMRVGDSFSHRAVLHDNLTRSADTIQSARHSGISSLSKAMTINDRKLYISELFGGDRDKFDGTIRAIDGSLSLAEGLAVLQRNYSGSSDNPLLEQFIALLERRFQGK